MTVLLLLLAAVLVIAGIVGLVVPPIPGALLTLAGLLLAAWAEDFLYVGWGTITALVILTLLTYLVDFVASIVGVKRFNASRRAMLGAVAGAVIGLFFGLPGIFLGPLVGASLGELWARRDITQAGRVGLGATIGLVLGIALKLMLGLAMVGLFVAMRFL